MFAICFLVVSNFVAFFSYLYVIRLPTVGQIIGICLAFVTAQPTYFFYGLRAYHDLDLATMARVYAATRFEFWTTH